MSFASDLSHPQNGFLSRSTVAIGKILLQRGLLSRDQLHIAEHRRQQSGQTLDKALLALGFIDESMLRGILAEHLAVDAIDLTQAVADPEALRRIPCALARRLKLLPIAYDPERRCLTLAMGNPHDLLALDQVRSLLDPDEQISPRLACDGEIEQAIDRHYGHELTIDGILLELGNGLETETGQARREARTSHDDEATARPFVRLVEAFLVDAVKQGASDIHFEPEAGFLRIRYRIDGLLQVIRCLTADCWPSMLVRLKIMSGMNITETRAPQDGRFSLNVSGQAIDFRIASQPTVHGENVVLRILDRKQGILGIEQLGLDSPAQQSLQRMLARPEGILLVTGPTGCGKTTTLYSLLAHANHPGIHIMTLEDPVEHPLPLIRQTSICDAIRLDFANGIRSMMRQDPDIILVGEIRDAETATMAFRAAMTGHQVFSTLHANSAVGAIPRLLDIGLKPGILAGNLIGIVAQRLLRRLCLQCRDARPATEEEQSLFAHHDANDVPQQLYHAVGCPACRGQGYRGRLAIMEILRFDATLDALVAEGASAPSLLHQARAQGFIPLAQAALAQVRQGHTSLAEAARVVNLSE